MRINIILECEECKARNYKTTKNKKTQSARLEQKKFCSSCKKHTVHRETK